MFLLQKTPGTRITESLDLSCMSQLGAAGWTRTLKSFHSHALHAKKAMELTQCWFLTPFCCWLSRPAPHISCRQVQGVFFAFPPSSLVLALERHHRRPELTGKGFPGTCRPPTPSSASCHAMVARPVSCQRRTNICAKLICFFPQETEGSK